MHERVKSYNKIKSWFLCFLATFDFVSFHIYFNFHNFFQEKKVEHKKTCRKDLQLTKTGSFKQMKTRKIKTQKVKVRTLKSSKKFCGKIIRLKKVKQKKKLDAVAIFSSKHRSFNKKYE